jgi:hypothetical protein
MSMSDQEEEPQLPVERVYETKTPMETVCVGLQLRRHRW